MSIRFKLPALALALALGAPAALTTSAHATQTEVADKKAKHSGTGIEWHVLPKSVQIYLDGKKLGDAGSLEFSKTKPGRHTVRLVNGEDETEMEIGIKKGQRLKFEFTFDDS